MAYPRTSSASRGSHVYAVEDNYRAAAEKVASGYWRVDAEKGVIYGLNGNPFVRRNTSGYIQTKFRVPGSKEISVVAHRVIWESVHGPLDSTLQINHINGIKDDNRIANLEAVTPRQNNRHARHIGLTPPAPKGSEHSCAKLTEDQALTIFRRAWAGERNEVIAQDYPVGTSMVVNIKYGLAWTHVTGHAA